MKVKSKHFKFMFAYKSMFYELCVIKRYRSQHILLNAVHTNLVYVNNWYVLFKNTCKC